MEETIEYKGYQIVIETDDNAGNPRTEWDNLGTMACFHKRYSLGDDKKTHELDSDDFANWAAMKKHIETVLNAAVVLPIYMYDHSGQTVNTTGFSCQWDSGQIGFIFITKEKARHEYSVKRISKKLKARLTEYLISEVQTYDDYMTGSVYGYKVLDENEEELDACWGYYGDNHEKSGLMEAAKNAIDCRIKAKVAADKLLHDIDSVS